MPLYLHRQVGRKQHCQVDQQQEEVDLILPAQKQRAVKQNFDIGSREDAFEDGERIHQPIGAEECPAEIHTDKGAQYLHRLVAQGIGIQAGDPQQGLAHRAQPVPDDLVQAVEQAPYAKRTAGPKDPVGHRGQVMLHQAEQEVISAGSTLKTSTSAMMPQVMPASGFFCRSPPPRVLR